MNGQWSGSYSGTNSGLLVMDLDDMDTHYEGRVFAYDDTPALPGTFAFIKTPDKRSSFQLSVDFLPVDPRTGVRQRFGTYRTLQRTGPTRIEGTHSTPQINSSPIWRPICPGDWLDGRQARATPPPTST
jgi:hypothetical protein